MSLTFEISEFLASMEYYLSLYWPGPSFWSATLDVEWLPLKRELWDPKPNVELLDRKLFGFLRIMSVLLMATVPGFGRLKSNGSSP